MAYNGLISTGNVDLHPEFLAEIFKSAEEQSVVLKLGNQLRNMTKNELKLTVSTALPEVYFVGTKGKTQTYPPNALKQTTTSEWEDVSIYAGELAAIVVIPNNVFNDADFDLFGEIKRQMPTAIAKKIDSAVLYGQSGVNVPSDWRDGILVTMPAAHKVAVGSVGDIYADLLVPSGVFYQVEKDGYDVNGLAGAISLKAQLRGLRDGATGVPLFTPSIQSPNDYTLAGVPIVFPRNGGFDANQSLLIAGDWSKLVYSIRQDVSFDVFTTGVVQDNTGAITHNLMQEDLTALRVTFRMGWALPQPAMWDVDVTQSGVYPFAAYVPA
ncbi:MAG: phage major capsid protein [Ignavibacterium sp.]|jgi:HK97 family phage major capsid protein|uniref:phage major capsid protein n=1 Tax=Ignavibacterium sp. TaxID=2651167 RepID=UPI0032996B24